MKNSLRYFAVLILFIIVQLIMVQCKKEPIDPPMPEGKFVYISTKDHNYGEIYLCNADGSDNKRISPLSTGSFSDMDVYPEVSPDRKKIKFRNHLDLKFSVYDIASGQLTTINDKCYQMIWLGKTGKLAYVPAFPLPGITGQIFTVNSDETNIQQLTFYNPTVPNSDTSISFNDKLMWYEKEQVIIAYGIMDYPTTQKMFYKINPANGRIVGTFSYNGGFGNIQNNKMIGCNGDTIFIFDLITHQERKIILEGQSPQNAVLSPDETRIAYIKDKEYQYNGRNYYCTDIVTCNLNGYDKRIVTEVIADHTKYKSSFSPFWISNNELIYSAGHIYKITDDIQPSYTIMVENVKAGGQIQFFKP